MAFQSSQIDIELVYTLNDNPASFSLIDNTDYSAETYSNILGLLRAVAPSGSQFYNNTSYASPDIDITVSNESAELGALPLTDGEVTNGVYNFVYTIKIEDMLQQHLVVTSNIGTSSFTVVGNIASQVVEATAADWEIIDAGTTALTIVSATYSASTGLTTIVVNETLPTLTALATFQYTVDVIYSKPFTQNYTYETPETCINVDIDDCCSSVTLTDNTAYPSGATVTRLHTVSYPKGMVTPIADVESPLQEVTITPIWTGTWTDLFIADIETTNGIISIIDETRFVKDFKVSTSQGLCEVYSCITNMATKYASYLTTAPQKAIEMSKYINQASAAYMAYTIGKKCGKEGYEIYLELIKAVAESCGCGCGDCGPCDDNTPVQVVGCCGNVGGNGNTIVISSPNSSITVTLTTVGTTDTFEIVVSAGYVTGLAEAAIAAASIDDLADVNTGNIAAANGQVLVWSTATSRWVRGSSTASLVTLTDVDDAGLANNMILYWDNGTSTFKFKLFAFALNDLTDVTITSVQDKDVLKYITGTGWVNAANTYQLLSDVNAAGLANGNSFRWDSGTSKFIPFAPKLTLNTLDDVAAGTPSAEQRLIYNASTLVWDKVAPPTAGTSLTFPAGYTAGPTVGFSNAGANYDRATNMVDLVGVVANSVGVSVSTTFIATVPTSMIPSVEIPFTCHVGIGAITYLAMGYIAAGSGNINIVKHYTGGTIVNGIPAGGIVLEGISYRLNR